MNGNTLKKKFIIIFLIIAMLVPYVPVFTPVVEAKRVHTPEEMKQEGDYMQFTYTGGVQEFTVPRDGIYSLQVAGGSGGQCGFAPNHIHEDPVISANDCSSKGANVIGYKQLKAGTKLYICVGGAGANGNQKMSHKPTEADLASFRGYNGGGASGWDEIEDGYCTNAGSGGGATHIATTLRGNGELYNYENYKDDILIVAGGGSGSCKASRGMKGEGWNYTSPKGEFAKGADAVHMNNSGAGGGWLRWHCWE